MRNVFMPAARLRALVFLYFFLSLAAIASAQPNSFDGEGPRVRYASGVYSRPTQWAVPISAEGIPNLYKVTDQFYRSGQPTARGMTVAENLGIKTVVSLRFSKDDEQLAQGTQLRLASIPMRSWSPRYEDAVDAMRLLHADSLEKIGPVLIHCRHGADCTGFVGALYRMVYQDWSRADAIEEMTQGDYGYHPMWSDIVLFLSTVDIEQLKIDAGAGEAWFL